MKQLFLLFLLCFSFSLSATVIDTIQPPLDTGNTTCNNCPFFMPDGFTGEAIIQVTGAVNNDLADSLQGLCGVYLNFDHEYIGDLDITLVSPAGQEVKLIGPIGFWGMTDATTWNIVFLPCTALAAPDPGFTANWSSNQPWGIGGAYTGSYYPFENCFENLDTGTVNGTWRLIITDAQAIDVGHLYQATLFFCDNRGLSTDSNPIGLNAGLQVGNYQNWSVEMYNTSIGANGFTLDWGDGSSSSGTVLPPIHEYADTGTYTLRLIATNGMELDTAYATVTIHGALPVASVIFDEGPLCVPDVPLIDVIFSDHVKEWQWHFPSGIPEYSTEMEPYVLYDAVTTELATLVVRNSVGADTFYFQVFTIGSAQANFTIVQQGNLLLLENTSMNESSIQWYVNDQLVSTNPVLLYDDITSGTYEIRLLAENQCSFDDTTQTIVVVISDAGLLDDAQSSLRLFPNPMPPEGQLYLTTEFEKSALLQWRLNNALGQEMAFGEQSIAAGETTLPLATGTLVNGVYWLDVQVEKRHKAIKLVVQKK